MQNKGQFLTTEFLFGTVIFSALVILLLVAFNGTDKVLTDKLENKKIYNFAYNTSELLVNTKGYPENWQDLNYIDINLIGLMNSQNKLNLNKVQKLIDYNIYYESTKEKLGLGKYNYHIAFVDATNSNIIYESGIKPDNNSQVVVITRYVVIDENILKLNLMVWE